MATQNLLAKQLIEFGLSEKEAKVYLALLELEVAAVSEVAKTANINRSSTYVVLENLKKKGLAGMSPDKPVAQYFASSPDSLIHTASTRAKREEDVKNNLKQILPELKALHKDTRHRPKVRVYEGIEGAREVFYTHFQNDFKVFANPVRMAEFIPDFLEANLERAKKGIKMRAINPATKEVLEFGKKYAANFPKGDEAVLIPEEKFNFPVHIAVCRDEVFLLSNKGKFGIIIESKDIAGSFESSFDLAWQEAKRLHKAIIKEEWKDDKK